MPSNTDFMSSDVRVYVTLVAIDEQVEGLKPGMSAEVTILVDEVNDVLRLPVHSVLESGGKKFCYVKTPAGTIEKRELVTGLNNYKFVEIKPESNLKVGELVVVNPRPVAEKRGDLQGNVYIDPAEGLKLPDRNGTAPRARPPADAPAADKPAAPGKPGSTRPQLSPEERERRKKEQAERLERFRNASPEERKQMLQQIPEQFRDRVKESLRSQGIEIPD
jgi:hypothetical protein